MPNDRYPPNGDRESRQRRFVLPLALLISLALIAVACGSRSAEVSTEGADGLEYGASLEEWSRALGAERDQAASSDNQALTAEYELVEWDHLVAPGFSGEDIAAQYADQLAAIADDSPEAEAIYEEMQDQYDGAAVNDQLDGTKIQLAGFVAPLTYEDDVVTEFLLVPYFGACIHVPPPPPHQTVLVSVHKADGLTIEESWGAVWVAGTLDVSSATTDLATASYAITGARTGVYDDF